MISRVGIYDVMDEIETPFGVFSFMTRGERSWHIPSKELVDLLKRYSPILSVFSGLALTERAAQAQGVDVICTDLQPPPNPWCRGRAVMPVQRLRGDRAVRRYPRRNVFMAWPPYGGSDARKCAEQVRGHLIYIGEDRYGCNADDSFFDLVREQFEVVDGLDIPQHAGIHDSVTVYRRLP